MSDAKRCDRCGNFYNMDDDISKRGKINNKAVNFIGAYHGGSTRCGYFDLCPDCSKSFVNWFDSCMNKYLPEEIDCENKCKNCFYFKQSYDQMPCAVCHNYDRFVEGGKIENVVF